MVSIMTQIIRNLSPLRIEAPEQYPIPEKGQGCENVKMTREYSEEQWKVPRRTSVKKTKEKNDSDVKCCNSHESLSEDDKEEEECEHDIIREMRREIDEGDRKKISCKRILKC